MSYYKPNITNKRKIERDELILLDNFQIDLINGNYQLNDLGFESSEIKIKFFLDTMIVQGYEILIGNYFELENLEIFKIKTNIGDFYLKYNVVFDGNNSYTFSIINVHQDSAGEPPTNINISNIVLQDSFYNSENGFFNEDNPNNKNDILLNQPPILQAFPNKRGNIEILTGNGNIEDVQLWNNFYLRFRRTSSTYSELFYLNETGETQHIQSSCFNTYATNIGQYGNIQKDILNNATELIQNNVCQNTGTTTTITVYNWTNNNMAIIYLWGYNDTSSNNTNKIAYHIQYLNIENQLRRL